MRNFGLDRSGDERARFASVVAVIAERIGDQFRHDDRPGEMNDGVDAMGQEQPEQKIAVAGIARDEFVVCRDRPAESGGQIVENDDVLAGIEQSEHHMAADIARPARDQNTHGTTLPHGNSSLAIGSRLREF